MPNWFFDGWEGVWRTLLVGFCAYAGLVIFLRISGRRTLSKMNAFDLVVTVSIGSTLATVLLNNNVSLTEGLMAFGLLIGLQFAVTWTSVRFRWFRRWITGEPLLLLHDGQFLPTAMKQARVSEEEIYATLRQHGMAGPHEAHAVVIETDGSFSVIADEPKPGHEGLKNVSHRR